MNARVRTALLAGAGLLLLQLGWILSVAPSWGIDEFDHAYRASSVASGHWQAGNDMLDPDLGRGDLIPVRKDVVDAARSGCTGRSYTGTYNCFPKADLGNGEVQIASAAARYNPVYYAVVGTVAAPLTGTAHLYAMRATSALLVSAMFVLAVWITLAGARTVWPLVAVLAAALPTTVYSTAVAAPNGLELVAGLTTWVALLAVVAPRGEQRRGSAYAVLALASAVLANTHTLGLLWLGLIVVAVAVLHGPVTVFRALLPRGVRELGLAGAAALALAFDVAWVLLSGVNNPSLEEAYIPGNPWKYVAQGLVLWPLQAIGAFPLRDEQAPVFVYAALVALLTVLAVVGLRRSSRRTRVTVAFVAVASFALPAYLTVQSFHQIGAAWQGRYGMPFTVGLVVLVGSMLDDRTRAIPRPRVFAVGAAVLLVAAQVVGQVEVAGRLDRTPAVASADWAAPATALLVGLAVLAAAAWVRSVWLQTSLAPVPTASPSSVRQLAEVI